jgi:xanthine dehydrogenase accessory factor
MASVKSINRETIHGWKIFCTQLLVPKQMSFFHDDHIHSNLPSIVLIRGGGDLASGVAIRLVRSGLHVVITELPLPLSVRRTVSFSEAVHEGQVIIEDISAQVVLEPINTNQIINTLSKQQIPVVVDPNCISAKLLLPVVIIDARMTKRTPELLEYSPELFIGLGPGFVAGVNCQAVVETHRGYTLGRVIWQGAPISDSGQPEGDPYRVLRSPIDGRLITLASIGDHIKSGQAIARINDVEILAPFKGVLRGLLRTNTLVTKGMKIGDIDHRDELRLCTLVSDKALAVGGGVLEAILSTPSLKMKLWN